MLVVVDFQRGRTQGRCKKCLSFFVSFFAFCRPLSEQVLQQFDQLLLGLRPVGFHGRDRLR